MSEKQKTRDGWNEAKPAIIPRGTPWPPAMAMGITFFAWGFVTSPVILGIGTALFVVALYGWIGEMRGDAS